MGESPGVELDVDLSAHNTFGLRARAARLVRLRSADQLAALIAEPAWASGSRLVLGGGQ